MVERAKVNWVRVAVMSAVGGVSPWLLGLMAKTRFDREYEEATRVRWTDKNRWEKD